MRAAAIALLIVVTLGCEHLQPYRRTLPGRIQTVYIPMPRNESFEYGLEEDLARALHEEFMSDGRLRVVRSQIADARLETTIRQFTRSTQAFNADDFPIFDEAVISARVSLSEPGRGDPTVDASVDAATSFISDPRRSQFVPEPEWRAELMRSLALEIVNEVLSHRVEDEDEDTAGTWAADEDEIDLDSTIEQTVPSIRSTTGLD